MNTMTHADWMAEGARRFGDNIRDWRFVCPSCGHVASVQDYLDADAPGGAIGFSCIGRYMGDSQEAATHAFKGAGGPCDYAGGGLFGLNPVLVIFPDGSESIPVFAFADVAAGGLT